VDQDQGDQVGRFFANWAIVYFRHFFLIREKAQIFWLLFPRLKLCINFDSKMCWATFWTILSPTHLVTLIQIDEKIDFDVIKKNAESCCRRESRGFESPGRRSLSG
jgi:hypothetical protein